MLSELLLGPIRKRINIMLLKRAVSKYTQILSDLKLEDNTDILQYYHLMFEIKGMVESLDFYCWMVSHDISSLSQQVNKETAPVGNMQRLENQKSYFVEYLNKYVKEKEKFL